MAEDKGHVVVPEQEICPSCGYVLGSDECYDYHEEEDR